MLRYVKLFESAIQVSIVVAIKKPVDIAEDVIEGER